MYAEQISQTTKPFTFIAIFGNYCHTANTMDFIRQANTVRFHLVNSLLKTCLFQSHFYGRVL